jgi:peptidyl-dipeptidase A
MTTLSRRQALKSAGALGAAALLAQTAGCATSSSQPADPQPIAGSGTPDANRFLADFTPRFQTLYTTAQNAAWLAATDVSEPHTEASITAQKALNQFVGDKAHIETLTRLRASAWRLDPFTTRQLNAAFTLAADVPGTIPDLVAERTAAEARQSAAQDGYRFTVNTKQVTANDLDEILFDSADEPLRRAAWESSKEIGKPLKEGLLNLRRLRNRCARELNYSSFFGLRVSDYQMSVPELMSLASAALSQSRPLFEHLHCYAKHKLAAKYNKPVPRLIPAHWLPNRWGQQWPGLEQAADLDPLFKDRTPEWIAHQAESFYTSMGFPTLPESFWAKSDLWDLPAGSARKKNAHASAWHIDLDQDIRSLQSIKPNADWFQTAHHELGHAHYFLSYSRPQVPILLRQGANRAFHEAIGELIALACTQRPYLAQIGILNASAAADAEKNADTWLLAQAMDGSNIVFQPFTWGVMTGWEHDFYEHDLPSEKMNDRWWELARRHQGIEPPSPRPQDACDPATKTHINDTAGQYYDYAICSMIVYQLHGYIARNILKQDPRNCNYYGRKDVGEYLKALLSLGATRDWREVLRDFTGEDLSARAMLDYYAPLTPIMQKLNRGRDVKFD